MIQLASKRSIVRRMAALFLVFVTLPVFGQSVDRRLFQDAENRFRAKDYEVALQKYDELIEKYPLSSYVPDAQFRRAVCNFRLGRPEQARRILELVEEKYGSTGFIAFVPFWKGVIAYNNQEYAKAARNLERYLETGEEGLLGQAKLILAVSENKLGNPERAIHFLEDIAEKGFQEQPYALPFLASLYIKQKLYDRVVSLVEGADTSVLNEEQQLRLTLYHAEALWHLNGRNEDAAALYDELLDAPADISSVAFQRLFAYYQALGDEEAYRQVVLNAEIQLAGKPEILSEFWLRIGIETFQEGRYDLSRSYFRRIWNLGRWERMDGLVPLYLAELQMRAGEIDRAINTLESFRAVSADRRELVLFRLGGIYLESEQWALADERLAAFLAAYGGSRYYGEGAYLRAYTLYQQQKYDEGLELIGDVLRSARAGGYTARLLRLQSILYKNAGDLDSAAATLREYIPLAPNDNQAKMDLVKLLFRIKDHDAVIAEVARLSGEPPFNDPGSPFFLLSQYMLGLSHIVNKEYRSATVALNQITPEAVSGAGLELILPYALFYRGWAYYRNGNYGSGEENFARLLETAPAHELQPRSAYLAGWCAFIQGDYEQAEGYLDRIAGSAEKALRIKAEFMKAKSLASQGRHDEAAILFEGIYLDNRTTDFADDALFELAGSLSKLGKIDESVATYRSVFEEFAATSPLSEEAMYKRGEILYEEGRYEEAREAFYEYRTEFTRRNPEGKLFDAALYWGGMASFNLDEPFGAVLLWEKLIKEYPNSTFRADALRRTAEVYEESGDFRKALNYYRELISLYPEEARAIQAERKAETLRFRILGQGEEEAELSVVIGKEGTNTAEGREAILELARIYIFKSGAKQNLAPPLLNQLIDMKEEDSENAAWAQYYFGEYYYRKNDLKRAANEFLQAISINPEDRDLAAQSLYKAAEMVKLAGNMEEARSLVKRIESRFPSSQWVEEGRKLVEEER